MRVDVYSIRGPAGYSYGRGDHIARALCEGFARHGIEHTFRTSFEGVQADVAIAYGWINGDVLKRYPVFAYFDLGYWNRRPERAPADGAHRLAFNSWDTAEHMPCGMPFDRFDAANIDLKQWVDGKSKALNSVALVAGMSAKSARVHGYKLGEWEREAARVAAHQGWRVVQRPKAPNRDAVQEPIARALLNCGLLVTHHSNCAVDALIAGVPVWAHAGVGKLVSPTFCPAPGAAPPLTTAGRRAVLADVAYAQWTVAEMRAGDAWAFMREYLYAHSNKGG
jgi:hypothetical protein